MLCVKNILTLVNSRYLCAISFLTLFSFRYFYTAQKSGEHNYDNIDPKKWDRDPIEKLHAQFYKYYIGLIRRAPNVVSRNEVGGLSLKLNI